MSATAQLPSQVANGGNPCRRLTCGAVTSIYQPATDPVRNDRALGQREIGLQPAPLGRSRSVLWPGGETDKRTSFGCWFLLRIAGSSPTRGTLHIPIWLGQFVHTHGECQSPFRNFFQPPPRKNPTSHLGLSSPRIQPSPDIDLRYHCCDLRQPAAMASSSEQNQRSPFEVLMRVCS